MPVLQLSAPRKRFLRLTLIIMVAGLVVYLLGEYWQESYLFAVGLAVLIMGLTMLGQILFQTLWVEEKEK